MLVKGISPCLDVRVGRVVKGTSCVALREAGDSGAGPGAADGPAFR